MITSIITSLGIVTMAVAIVLLTVKHSYTQEAIEQLHQIIDKKASDVELQAVKQRLVTQIADSTKTDSEINDIIDRLNHIIVDIKRLDEEVAKVAKAEREIRAYYCNFRQPTALPVYDAGVPWAKNQKCFDDMSDEEKIHELGKRADIYLDLMEKGNTADMVRYTEEYNKCVAEIQQLIKGEHND